MLKMLEIFYYASIYSLVNFLPYFLSKATLNPFNPFLNSSCCQEATPFAGGKSHPLLGGNQPTNPLWLPCSPYA